MSKTRNTLEKISSQLDESMGVRANDMRPQLSPVASPKDIGRRALRNFGTLAIESVIPDPEQPRTEFDEEQIERLAQSIREKGQLHPIRVRWSERHAQWIIISGERRYRATKKAGLPSIECHFQESELTKTEILEQQLIENLLREDLKPIEEAKAFQQLMRLNSWTGKELATAIRIQPSKVSRSIALLKLPEDLQQRVESGELPVIAAYELSRLTDDAQRRAALERGRDDEGHFTVAKAKSQVRQRQGKAAAKPRGVKQTFLTEDGYKVTVSSGKKGNYHEIEQALQQALEEVRARIQNNVWLE
jgi:ParB family transcriptional regulator, chromosome partitioning protein